jgi:pyruvate formate lyase activating enzyme
MDRRAFLANCGRCALFATGLGGLARLVETGGARAAGFEQGRLGVKLSPYFTPLEAGLVRCELCPRQCETAPGERGYCDVRENRDGRLYSLVYGNPCAVHVDPVEKKPFFHVLPGSRSFSIATAGCNFDCKFCQNWEISQAPPDETFNYELTPEGVVGYAARTGCRSIASTYVEPTIFMEYMLDVGRRAKERGLLKVMHSNGYVKPRPLADLCEVLDAACIDLKGITESYYREFAEGTLQPVLDTLKTLRKRGVHVEIVNLLVPGKNDSPPAVRDLSRWIRDELGPGTPLHFSRFYPLYKLKSLPPTPVSTLERARATAQEQGLQFVYVGNVPGNPGEHTYCPECGDKLIERIGYRVKVHSFDAGLCGKCGGGIPGIWT